MVTAEEIVVRAHEIGEQIRVVKKLIPQIEPKEQVKQYTKRLDKRMELVRYIENLEANDGYDFDNLEEGEEIGKQHQNQELNNLHRNKRYWKNIGIFYNRVFDKKLKWEGKTELIDLKIKEEEERLKKVDEEEPAKEESVDQELKIEEVDEEIINYDKSESQEPEIELEQDLEKRTIEEVEEEDDEEELERQNQKLERSIRKIEREKKQIEVDMTRKN